MSSSSTNKLCKLLRCRYPFIQAPMLGSVDETLALAVAKAGGVGSVPCTPMTPTALDEVLGRHRREHPDLALNYNFFCHEMPPATVSKSWLVALQPLYAKEDIAMTEKALTASFASSLTPTFTQAHVDLLLKHRPPAVSFHFGLPPTSLWHQLKDSGIKFIVSATTVAEGEALLADDAVDVVVAQGIEAGGHRGIFLATPPTAALPEQLPAADLVRALRRQMDARPPNAVSPVLVAAGGIGSAQDVQAALNGGADGVQVGTAFLLCEEATTHPAHRAALLEARRTNAPSYVTNVLSGRPAQGIENAVMREVGVIREDAPPYPLSQNYLDTLKKKDFGAYGSLWCGRNRAGLCAIPAAEQVNRLVGSWFPA